jgi:O-succinylhomoserine sulfhydrylase
MDGQGRVLGGVTVGEPELIKIFHHGTFHLLMLGFYQKSLETLAIRLDRHCENALKVAEFLEQHQMLIV